MPRYRIEIFIRPGSHQHPASRSIFKYIPSRIALCKLGLRLLNPEAKIRTLNAQHHQPVNPLLHFTSLCTNKVFEKDPNPIRAGIPHLLLPHPPTSPAQRLVSFTCTRHATYRCDKISSTPTQTLLAALHACAPPCPNWERRYPGRGERTTHMAGATPRRVWKGVAWSGMRR